MPEVAGVIAVIQWYQPYAGIAVGLIGLANVIAGDRVRRARRARKADE
jgi:hypothetical protein